MEWPSADRHRGRAAKTTSRKEARRGARERVFCGHRTDDAKAHLAREVVTTRTALQAARLQHSVRLRAPPRYLRALADALPACIKRPPP